MWIKVDCGTCFSVCETVSNALLLIWGASWNTTKSRYHLSLYLWYLILELNRIQSNSIEMNWTEFNSIELNPHAKLRKVTVSAYCIRIWPCCNVIAVQCCAWMRWISWISWIIPRTLSKRFACRIAVWLAWLSRRSNRQTVKLADSETRYLICLSIYLHIYSTILHLTVKDDRL